MTWTDARILHAIWAQQFDPSFTSLEYAGAAAQEAWLRVASAARLLAESPTPAPAIIPGLPYLARFHRREGWADIKAPDRPQLIIQMSPQKLFVIETFRDELPTLTGVNIKPDEIREVPGLVYETPPMQFTGVKDEALKPDVQHPTGGTEPGFAPGDWDF